MPPSAMTEPVREGPVSSIWSPPDNIHQDPTIKERTFCHSRREDTAGVFQALVPYGRLVDYHSMIVPTDKAWREQGSFAELCGQWFEPRKELLTLINEVARAQCTARGLKPETSAVVLFEHGNQVGRWFPGVPSMNCLVTSKPTEFVEELMRQFGSDGRWYRMRDVHSFVHHESDPYFMISVGDSAWTRVADDSRKISPQLIRKIVQECLLATSEAIQETFLWRSAQDYSRATRDAAVLQHIIREQRHSQAA